MINVTTPVSENTIKSLKVGDTIEISGYIYAGRDAVLPKLVQLVRDKKLKELGIDLGGSVVFHTAVSPAGIGPTTSNKLDIESSIPELSRAGVKVHLGKGSLSDDTVDALRQFGSIYVVTPPATALLTSKIKSITVSAYKEEGMEALHLLKVEKLPAIVAIAHGDTIFKRD